MMSTNRLLSHGRLPVIATIAVLIAACTIQEQSIPSSLSGPSELGLGMSLTAAPEFLPRDGSSMSTITAKTFDSNGKPLPGQRLKLDATAGTLTVSEIVTGSDGSATFTYIAPGLNENVNVVAVSAVPIQNTHLANANPRYVEILVSGPDIPVTFFSFNPAAPAQFQLVTFDGSGSSLGGSPCGSACSFAWDFGDGTTGTGMTTQHRFTSQGAFFVTLTVTSPSGTFRSQTRTVNVGSPIAPTAAFTFSPTNPEIGDTVFFNGAASTAVNGATIVEYRWDLGNGVVVTTATPTTSTTYPIDRAFRVRLTVLDSNGLTGFVDQTVTVSVP